MSSTTETGLLAAQLPSRFSFMRSRDFPLVPLLILGIIAFVAVFANLLAPHDPQVGSLSARFRPPFWLARGSLDTRWVLTSWAAMCCHGLFSAPASPWWSASQR